MEKLTTTMKEAIKDRIDNITKCGKCPFYFIGPITKFKRCLLSDDTAVNADDECFFENGNVAIDNDVARGILLFHNEWCRGADCLLMSPRLLGMAIDYAIMKLKNTYNPEEIMKQRTETERKRNEIHWNDKNINGNTVSVYGFYIENKEEDNQ